MEKKDDDKKISAEELLEALKIVDQCFKNMIKNLNQFFDNLNKALGDTGIDLNDYVVEDTNIDIKIEEVMELCWLIHKYKKCEGVPKIIDGKCEGYQIDENNDEPCETCKECRFNTYYE